MEVGLRPYFHNRAVGYRVPDFLDGNVADRNAAIRPVVEKPNRIGMAEARRHAMDEDLTARIDMSGFRSMTVLGTRIGYMQFTMKDGLRVPSVDNIDPFGGAAVAKVTLGAGWMPAERDGIGFEHRAITHKLKDALALDDDDAIGLNRRGQRRQGLHIADHHQD